MNRTIVECNHQGNIRRVRWLRVEVAVLAAAIVVGWSTPHVCAQTLLAGYDFQTTSNGGTAAGTAPNAPLIYLANFGTQAGAAGLYLNGSRGSSTFVTATTGNEVTGFGGTGVNAGTGFNTSTTSPSCLGIVGGATNGSSFTANGKSMVFAFSMTGYQNLVLTFATRSSGTSGFNNNTVSYSTDGTNFTQFASGISPTTSTTFATVTENFSAITALNNAANIYIAYTFNGATDNNGNNRLDNIQFNASPVPEPATCLGGFLLVGAAGWNQRRRVRSGLAVAVRFFA